MRVWASLNIYWTLNISTACAVKISGSNKSMDFIDCAKLYLLSEKSRLDHSVFRQVIPLVNIRFHLALNPSTEQATQEWKHTINYDRYLHSSPLNSTIKTMKLVVLNHSSSPSITATWPCIATEQQLISRPHWLLTL